MASFTLNGKPVKMASEPQLMLLWALRDNLGLTGTKYGCGASLCGACTVHVNGEQRHAGAHGLAVHMHGAGATQARTATIFGTGQTSVVAQCP